jgi:signal transduction histidine kinase
VWTKSLYRRIAAGFVLVIAGTLAAQGGIFLWLVNRSGASQTQVLGAVRETSERLGAELARDAHLEMESFLASADVGAPLFAIMTDGRIFGKRPPESICNIVNRQFARSIEVPPSWELSSYLGVPIAVGGVNVGVMGIVPYTPFEQFALPMALVGVGVLVAGSTVAALLVGGPVGRRLGDLGSTARRIGSGDLTARASEEGADEVAAFARTLNAMAAQLEARAHQAQASDQARSQLVAEVSHELMTPMTAIRGNLETLAMDDVHVDPPTRKRFVAVMMKETERLQRLIGDLLDMARLEAGGGGLDVHTVHVEDLFDTVVEHHEQECKTRGIHLTCCILPGAETLSGDSFRLGQAVDNLAANAFRHTHDGGSIAFKSELARDVDTGHATVRLTVTDSGEGIPAAELALIFDRFYKAKSGRRGVSNGSGLGLSIVKAIVERHGGRVWATSVLGRGTTIGLELPSAPPSH